MVRVLKLLVLVPIWFVVVAQESPSPVPTPTPPCPTPTSPPTISLSAAAGRATVKITATGAGFDCGLPINLYWDSRDHPAGTVTTTAKGTFVAAGLSVYAGAKPGIHRLCADVTQNPCANFTLQGPPSPSPKASSAPRTSPSPSPSPSQSPSPLILPGDNTPTALDILTRPPFVFFPIIAILGLLGAIAYWALSNVKPRPAANLPTASVVHRSARPDMGPVGPTSPPAPMQPPPPVVEPPPSPPEGTGGESANGPQEPSHLD